MASMTVLSASPWLSTKAVDSRFPSASLTFFAGSHRSASVSLAVPSLALSYCIATNPAAVVICLFEGENGDLRVILTKRSSAISSHSGEVALPGGKREVGDADDVETALREANEEIGLEPSLVKAVGVFQPYTTKHGVVVVPVIGLLSNKSAYKAKANDAEVEAIFDAPLEMFLKDEKRSAVENEYMGDKYLLHFFHYEFKNTKYVIWALTAGILTEAASFVYRRPPEFLERRPKFWSGISDIKEHS